MRVWIHSDEWYPVYEVGEEEAWADGSVDVDEETVARWERVTAEFNHVQVEMREALKVASGA